MARHKIVPAVYGIVRNKNQVLLIKRANTGYMDGMYSLPAGHVETKESAKSSIIRELKEEIGIDVVVEQLKFVHVAHAMSDKKDHERVHFFFEITEWSGDLHNAEPSKCDELKWFDMDNLPTNIAPDVSTVLPLLAKDQYYSEYNF
ncbi:MAG: NUDIX domain-containing protein [Patescibacteria group bacterium]